MQPQEANQLISTGKSSKDRPQNKSSRKNGKIGGRTPLREEGAAKIDVKCGPLVETLIAKHVESTIRSGVMVQTNREIHALILTTKE